MTIVFSNDLDKLLYKCFFNPRGENSMRLDKIKNGLKTDFIGREIYYFKEVTSTNDQARRLALKGISEGTIVIAEKQRRGRGRRGKRWLSPKGGIWLSVILKPQIRPFNAFKLTFVTAVAVAKAIKKMFKLDAQIKWPNDILVQGKKICGILTEVDTTGNCIHFIIIGIGINANVGMHLFPKHLQYNVTSLKRELKEDIDRAAFVKVLLTTFERYYKLFLRSGFETILNEWLALNCVLGKYIEVLSSEGTYQGKAVNIDKNGALMVKLDDGTIKKVVSESIILKRLNK